MQAKDKQTERSLSGSETNKSYRYVPTARYFGLTRDCFEIVEQLVCSVREPTLAHERLAHTRPLARPQLHTRPKRFDVCNKHMAYYGRQRKTPRHATHESAIVYPGTATERARRATQRIRPTETPEPEQREPFLDSLNGFHSRENRF